MKKVVLFLSVLVLAQPAFSSSKEDLICAEYLAKVFNQEVGVETTIQPCRNRFEIVGALASLAPFKLGYNSSYEIASANEPYAVMRAARLAQKYSTVGILTAIEVANSRSASVIECMIGEKTTIYSYAYDICD